MAAGAAPIGGAAAAMSWHEDLATLVGDTGVHYPAGNPIGDIHHTNPQLHFAYNDDGNAVGEEEEAEEPWQDQIKGFVQSTAEMMRELGRGCWDIARQSVQGVEDSELVKSMRGPVSEVAERLSFLNEYLPEDKEPAQAWPIVISVFLIALLVLNLGGSSSNEAPTVEAPKKMYIAPPSATRIQLPDGRHLAYLQQGVPPELTRFNLIMPHSFLSSRLAGIPGLRPALLEEFGVQLVTYDLPGFGESDPHPDRNLNSSALDMLHLANSLGIREKFWVVGYSGGAIHAWAAVRYIPDNLAGVAMFAPMVNPYDPNMNKEEKRKTWEKWSAGRKFMYTLARKFPSLLSFFYRRSFLLGTQGQPEKWLSFSLVNKDMALLEEPAFRELWERDVAESVRQGDATPFVEEAVIQVSDWGFTLSDLQVQKQKGGSGFLSLLRSFLSPTEKEWAGFLGPIHVWQGMDDTVVPPSMTEFVRRVVPGATVHTLHGEGHFSYFCFCDKCHRQIFSTLFGVPQGPLTIEQEIDEPAAEFAEETTTTQEEIAPEETVTDNNTEQEEQTA